MGMATPQTYELTDKVTPGSIETGDKELTLSFQAGDRGAYDSIYLRYSQRVNFVCQRMLADPQDAQDAAQETFLRVYQALPRFNGRYQLGAWINRIATNVCLDLIRSRKRTPAEAAPNEVLEEVVSVDTDKDPEEVMLRSAEGGRIQETLASLSPLHRTAILMRDLEGRDYRDIASILGVTECRARVLLHRARKGFRKSWSSAWVIFGVPPRLLARFRRVKAPADHVAQAAHAGHVASSAPIMSCSQVIQQCGEIVTERMAAVATAALIGVSVAGAAAPAALDPAAMKQVPGVEHATEAGAEMFAAVADAVREGAQDARVLITGGEVDQTASGAGPEAAAAPVEGTSGAAGGVSAIAPLSEAAPVDTTAPTSTDAPAPSGTEPTDATTAPDPTVPAEAPSSSSGGTAPSSDGITGADGIMGGGGTATGGDGTASPSDGTATEGEPPAVEDGSTTDDAVPPEVPSEESSDGAVSSVEDPATDTPGTEDVADEATQGGEPTP